ncbi:MAG: T9SS type A sorting domain-containing protein, partial [Lentimicrobiaceae bacterium]|nr:T9SS type A sorting domain-containing protein [Lentimicrobiaceae bacterium]
CYTFANWTEGGTIVSTDSSYTFTVNGNRTLVANFVIKTFTITATAGANGTISPGTVTVNCDANQTFEFTPNDCYEINEVLVDGTNNPAAVAAGSYTFNNVTASHTISVTFKIKTHSVTLPATITGITFTPTEGSGSPVNCGDSFSFTVTLDDCYTQSNIVVKANGITLTHDNGIYAIANITEDQEVTVEGVQLNTYTITATTGANGTISPSGDITVNCGDNQSFKFTAEENYKIDMVFIDGLSIPETEIAGLYTFNDVDSNHFIHVTFTIASSISEPLLYQITIYPNPTTGELTIENGELRIENVEVFDIYGKKLYLSTRPLVHSSTVSIDISHLASGIYFVKISTDEGVVMKKVVKE